MTRAAVLAVDGGNSKTDVALVAADGTLLAALRGPTTSHQAAGIDVAMERLGGLVAEAALQAGIHRRGEDGPVADLGSYSLAGADLDSDVRLLARSIGRLGLASRISSSTTRSARSGPAQTGRGAWRSSAARA